MFVNEYNSICIEAKKNNVKQLSSKPFKPGSKGLFKTIENLVK